MTRKWLRTAERIRSTGDSKGTTELCSGYLSWALIWLFESIHLGCLKFWLSPLGSSLSSPKGYFLSERNLDCPPKKGLFQKILDMVFHASSSVESYFPQPFKASKAPKSPLRTIRKSQELVSGFSEPQDLGWCLVLKGLLHEWELFWNLPTRNTALLCSPIWEIHTTPSLLTQGAIL